MSLAKHHEKVENGVRIIVYRVRKVINGKYCRGTIQAPTVAAAQELYKRWLLQQSVGDSDPHLFSTFDRYIHRCKQRDTEERVAFKSSTIAKMKDFFRDIPLRELRRKDVLTYVEWRRNKPGHRHLAQVKPATLNREIAVLSHFFSWARETEIYAGENPVFRCKQREDNTRVIILSQAQIDEMLSVATEYERKIVFVALNTAMRHREMSGLRWSAVDFENSIIRLEANETKGKKRRDIPMTPGLCDFLLRERQANPFSQWVFTWRGERVRSFTHAWESLRKKLSFVAPDGSPLRLHDLRHVSATYMISKGVPIRVIQAILGHSDIATTERYASFNGDGLREAMTVLDGINQKQIKEKIG